MLKVIVNYLKIHNNQLMAGWEMQIELLLFIFFLPSFRPF